MIVHLHGSARDKKNFPYLEKLVQTIHEHGAVIARDWLEAEKNRMEGKLGDKDVDWAEIAEANLDATNRADIVIIEATSYGFMQGYQLALSLQHRKPTLLVSRDDLKGRALAGLRNKFLTMKAYSSEEELVKIANKFIRDNKISTKDLRFNFFIDRQIYNYLREVSYETGKNKSEIIRELLDNEIKRREG